MNSAIISEFEMVFEWKIVFRWVIKIFTKNFERKNPNPKHLNNLTVVITYLTFAFISC